MEWAHLKYLAVFLATLLIVLFVLTSLYYYPYSESCMQAGWNANYSFLFAALLLLLLTAVGGSSVKKVRKSSDQEKHEATLNQSTLSPADNPAFDLIRKLLEDDEFRIVKIILENEGVTQDSLHFRTGFSQSKISIIVKKLEEKNLIVRERFGRTYKVYPSEWFRKMLV